MEAGLGTGGRVEAGLGTGAKAEAGQRQGRGRAETRWRQGGCIFKSLNLTHAFACLDHHGEQAAS